jgi:serine phosphatase RsbU (regulator of sigma subunit)
VGLLPLREYEVHMEPLSAGDLLAVWTDGLDETTDEAGRELGHEAVERVIVESADRPLSEIRRAVFDVVGSHGPQQDDRSLLLIRVGIQQR